MSIANAPSGEPAGTSLLMQAKGSFPVIPVGMSGRSITSDTVPGPSPHGLHTRLHSHFSGRRSGDQFCVYVADRLVLSLTPADIEDVSTGRHQMEAHVRKYIHANLGYRLVIFPDGKTAREVEKLIRNGAWGQGKPLRNPSSK